MKRNIKKIIIDIVTGEKFSSIASRKLYIIVTQGGDSTGLKNLKKFNLLETILTENSSSL